MKLNDVTAPAAEWKGTARYEVVRCIGRGGMGVVYEAFDRERRQSVALKTLPSFDADRLYRFKHEFRTLADVHHTNLVHLYELVGSGTGDIFFTMELVPGTDFARFVQASTDRAARKGFSPPSEIATVPTPPERERARAEALAGGSPPPALPPSTPSPADMVRLRQALRQLVQGVHAIHSAGKLHRDLKPSNVRVTPEGRLVILDFGVAVELWQIERGVQSGSGEVVGTARYMAPEHVGGDDALDPASDWYSVGVMLYEALVGRPPFAGSAADMLTLKVAFDPLPPSACVSGVPADLDALCVALLQRDPSRRPRAAEILRLLGASPGGDPAAPPAGIDPGVTFVGRETELQALRDAFTAARAGRSITVFIGGASGIGKSTIVHHFLDELVGSTEVVVLRGRAYERETVPYKAVDSAIDALSRYLMHLVGEDDAVPLPQDIWTLGRLFPVLERVPGVAPPATPSVPDPRNLRPRAFAALRELFATLTGRQPVVLFVDDAQWGDVDSAVLLLDLLRPPEPPPVLIVMTYRHPEGDASPFLRELRERWPDGAEAREVAVQPLDLADAQRLAHAHLDSSDETARAVAQESGGSPFLIEELARNARGSATAGEASRVAPTMDQMVVERLGRLPEAVRRLVEIVAVAGRPLPVSTATTAASDPPARANDAMALVCAQRFARLGLRDGCEVVEMTHDRLRETVVRLLPAAVVREHHGRLATALEGAPDADLEALALHLLGAGEPRRGAQCAERAAEQAASQLAFDQAARLFRVALDTIDGPEPETRRLRVRLAQMLEGAGRASSAADEYRKAAQDATAIERIELERSAAEQLVVCGRVDEGALAMRRVLASMGMRAPRSALGAVVSLLFHQAWLAMLGLRFRERGPAEVSREDRVRVEALRAVSDGLGAVDVILGACIQARHVLLAMRVGDRLQVLHALCVQLVQFAVAGRRENERQRRLLDVARNLAARSGPEGQRYFDATCALALYVRGRYREALEALDAIDTRDKLRHAPHRSGSANIQLFAIYSCFFLGRLREEARRAQALLRDVEDRGDVYTAVSLRSTVMVDICLAADDPEGARRHLREAMGRWTRSGFHVQHWYAMWSEVNIELYVGDGARASARLRRDARALKRSFLLHSRTIRGFTAFVRGCCAIGNATRAGDPALGARLKEARWMARRLEREPAGWSGTLACLLLAAAANAAGERRETVELLRTALARATDAGMMLHAWAVRYRLGSLLGGDEGRALVAQAEQAMGAEGVRAPGRMAGLFLPGCWEPEFQR